MRSASDGQSAPEPEQFRPEPFSPEQFSPAQYSPEPHIPEPNSAPPQAPVPAQPLGQTDPFNLADPFAAADAAFPEPAAYGETPEPYEQPEAFGAALPQTHEPMPVQAPWAESVDSFAPERDATPSVPAEQPVTQYEVPEPHPVTDEPEPVDANPTPVAIPAVAGPSGASIAAASTRIEGNIKIGPTPRHDLITLLAGAAAVVLLIGGVGLAYRSTEADSSPVVAAPILIDDEAPEELPLAFGVAISEMQARAEAGVVRLSLNDCEIYTTAVGVIVADNTVLARRSDLLTDTSPTLHFPDGSTAEGHVIGFSTTRNLAVVRISTKIEGSLNLAGETRIQPGTGVFVADIGNGLNFEIEPLQVLGVQGRNSSGATTLTLESDAAPGSPVIDTAGNMVALMGPDGRAVLADDLRSLVGRLFLANDEQASECPAPVVEIDPATGEPVEDVGVTD